MVDVECRQWKIKHLRNCLEDTSEISQSSIMALFEIVMVRCRSGDIDLDVVGGCSIVNKILTSPA